MWLSQLQIFRFLAIKMPDWDQWMFIQNLKEYKQKAQSSYAFEGKILFFILHLEAQENLLQSKMTK